MDTVDVCSFCALSLGAGGVQAVSTGLSQGDLNRCDGVCLEKPKMVVSSRSARLKGFNGLLYERVQESLVHIS